MIEEQEKNVGPVQPHEADGYAYDYFKFLTSLSLLTLAGIFAISQMDGAMEQIGKGSLIAIMATVAAGGIASFMGVGQIVHAKTSGIDSARKIAGLLKAAPALYCVGLGASLWMFLDVMY